MQLQPEHFIHPHTRVLAAAMQAADQHGGHFWPAEMASFLGEGCDVPAAYALRGHLPTINPAQSFQHHGELHQAFVDRSNTQLCAAILMLRTNVCRMPKLICIRKWAPIPMDQLWEVLAASIPWAEQQCKAA